MNTPLNAPLDTKVSIEELSKWYGSTRGIDRLSFQMQAGEVFGFLGPNGSGKTTAIRTILGLITATSGRCEVLGSKSLARDIKVRNRIGYLPGIAATYENYTAYGYLKFIARMRKLDLEKRINEFAERLDLDLQQHIHDLSKGNRQKVSLIQAFMHDPELLFLDEPTSGLDPLIQREFETILKETTSRGGTVLLSSHILSEVEHLATRVAILYEGRAIAIEAIAALKAKARRQIELFFPGEISSSSFTGVEGIQEIDFRGDSIKCVITGSEFGILQRAVALGVTEVRSAESSLEEIFLDLIRKQ